MTSLSLANFCHCASYYNVKTAMLRSTSALPIPGTCFKSSTVLKGPYSSR